MTETSWYRRWFGEEYLEVYPHRDQGEAARGVELVLRSLPLPAGGRVLDLACGAGRHLTELRSHGLSAAGLDLSLPLLRIGRGEGSPVARGDMRVLPFRSGAFDLVTNFFTSFGYFDDPADDLRVLGEVRRVLRTGGFFAFDFLHAERVRATLVSRDERSAGGRRIVQTRSLLDAGRTVEKRIEILDPANRLPHVFHERVRLYEPDELRRLLGGAGLTVSATFGDYEGKPLTADSPRVIHLGKAE
jgi:SAM-dependent methyltransferase